MRRKTIKFKCDDCDRYFNSERGRNQHQTKAHPYIPPPPPKKEIEDAIDESEKHTLIGGSKSKIGDVIWLGRKAVIWKIIRTEGSPDIVVELRITKKWYSTSEIS